MRINNCAAFAKGMHIDTAESDCTVGTYGGIKSGHSTPPPPAIQKKSDNIVYE